MLTYTDTSRGPWGSYRVKITVECPKNRVRVVFWSNSTQLHNVVKASEWLNHLGFKHDINKLSYHAI